MASQSTRGALLLCTSLMLVAWGAAAREIRPNEAVGLQQHGMRALLPAAGCADSSGTPWSAIGLNARPSWVGLCTERRLRLLPALAAIQQSVSNDAGSYFGSRGPGLAVGLVLYDGLYFSHGFGYRDALKKAAPDETTLFRAGSLSKVMTATALLTLTDDPSMSMSLADEADSSRYLPELRSVCASFNATCPAGASHLGIKLSHLVSHTAGLADVMEQTNAGIPTWTADLQKSSILFAPGQYSAYSGVGVEGVGLIEQRVSGAHSYPDFVREHLFAPLGMSHSTMDPLAADTSLSAQRWLFSVNSQFTNWSFAQANGIIAGDDQALILPAGGLTTSVDDLSHFLQMWLTDKAPILNGRVIINSSTLVSANLSQATGTVTSTCGNTKDHNGFYYSPCAAANGFGIGWYVGNTPFIMHNGDEPGLSGSETMVDQQAYLAATGLVSTEPYPSSGTNGQGVKNPQPAGLDGSFIDTVVWGHLMNATLNADQQTSWAGQAIAVGTARLLWLSGVMPPIGVGGPVKIPGSVPSVHSKPGTVSNAPPGYVPIGNGMAEPSALRQYQQSLLAQFSQSFLTENTLNYANIDADVSGLFGNARPCSSFRVLDAQGNSASLRFLCGQHNLDLTLTVDGSGAIADVRPGSGAALRRSPRTPLLSCVPNC